MTTIEIRTEIAAPIDIVFETVRDEGPLFPLSTVVTNVATPTGLVTEHCRGRFRVLHEIRLIDDRGSTHRLDQVSYVLPWGIVGRMLNRAFVVRYLSRRIEKQVDAVTHASEARAATTVTPVTPAPGDELVDVLVDVEATPEQQPELKYGPN